MLKVSQF